MERLSIAIPSDMKKQLGLMAKANFRNLNGEINKALDDYIRKNGASVVEDAPNWWECELKVQECQPQQEPILHQNAPIITTLIIDIGMKTTDVILVEWNGKFTISNYGTTNIALYDMYKVLQDKIASEGVEVTIEQIDKKFQSNKPIIRTEKGDFNLVEHLGGTLPVCRDIMKDIENKFGKTILHDKVFVGGGSEKFLGAVEGKIRHNVEVPQELRWYGNALGYLSGL